MARIPAVDRIKAAAIVTVVWIHCGQHWGARPTWMEISTMVTAAAVPAFLIVSGVVHQRRTPYPSGQLVRWARRILVPYLLASIAAWVVRAALGESLGLRSMARDLVTGSAWHIFYFVPIILACLLASMALARWPSIVWIATVLALVAIPCVQIPGADPLWRLMRADVLFWIQRDPLRWFGFFAVGWSMAPLVRERRLPRAGARLMIVAWLFILALLFPRPAPGFASSAAYTIAIGLCVVGLLALCNDGTPSRLTRALSARTLEIYLFHMPIVVLLRHIFWPSRDFASSLLVFSVTMALLLVTLIGSSFRPSTSR